MANKKTLGRVIIPNSIEELLTLAQSVYKKHQNDGGSSILKGLQDYNWDTLGPNVAQALAKHREAEDLRRRMENAYKERDLMLGEIRAAVRSTAAMLKGANAKNPKRLGEWGFVVDDTPKTKKESDDNSPTM